MGFTGHPFGKVVSIQERLDLFSFSKSLIVETNVVQKLIKL